MTTPFHPFHTDNRGKVGIGTFAPPVNASRRRLSARETTLSSIEKSARVRTSGPLLLPLRSSSTFFGGERVALRNRFRSLETGGRNVTKPSSGGGYGKARGNPRLAPPTRVATRRVAPSSLFGCPRCITCECTVCALHLPTLPRTRGGGDRE